MKFEAQTHARLEGGANTFTPFIGVFDDPFVLRTPDRLAAELEIALEHGDGDLVFCTIADPHAHEQIRDVVTNALA